ncbi:MAG: cytochrome C [Bacillota bacterium]
MSIIRKETVVLLAMWIGMGFLVGLTGSVISAPKYYPLMEEEVALVYNLGLTPEGQQKVTTATSGSQGVSNIGMPEEIFTTKACVQCHRITYYELKGGETGPDLSIAYTDVPDRFGRSLEDFLREPEGTMGAIIPDRLNDEDKVIILDLIKKAHDGRVAGRLSAYDEGETGLGQGGQE